MDDRELDSSCYGVKNGQIVLTQAYLTSLGYGKHELFLDTKGGGHTFVFSTRADGVNYVESGNGATWSAGTGDGLVFVFKRTVDDETAFAHFTGIEADGWTFGGWYTDKECTRSYDFSTPVTSDVTLYAKWTKKSSSGTTSKSPKTGDPLAGAFAIALALAAASALALALSRRRRRG